MIWAFFFFKGPLFLQDCRYALKMLRVRSKRTKFREKNPFYTVLDCFLDAVQKHPHKPFIVFEDEVHSYLQVDQVSNRVAWALQKHQGAIVALMLGNEPALVWTWVGLFKIGCSVSMLNTNIRTRSLLHCFNCCSASVLIAGAGKPKTKTSTPPTHQHPNINISQHTNTDTPTPQRQLWLCWAVHPKTSEPSPSCLRASLFIAGAGRTNPNTQHTKTLTPQHSPAPTPQQFTLWSVLRAV